MLLDEHLPKIDHSKRENSTIHVGGGIGDSLARVPNMDEHLAPPSKLDPGARLFCVPMHDFFTF